MHCIISIFLYLHIRVCVPVCAQVYFHYQTDTLTVDARGAKRIQNLRESKISNLGVMVERSREKEKNSNTLI